MAIEPQESNALRALLGEVPAVLGAWQEDPGDPDDLYDLLALHDNLCRFPSHPGKDSAMEAIKHAIADAKSLVRDACLAAFHPDQWIASVTTLVARYRTSQSDDPFSEGFVVNAEERARAVRELLRQIDDAQLALSAALRLSESPSGLDAWGAAITACADYARSEPEFFLDAASWAKSMSEAFMPYGELLATETRLARTAELLALVLAAADSWDGMRQPPILQGPPPTLTLLAKARVTPILSPPRTPIVLHLISDPPDPARLRIRSPSLAAAGSAIPIDSDLLQWESENCGWRVLLGLPAEAFADDKVVFIAKPSPGEVGPPPTHLQLETEVFPFEGPKAEVRFAVVQALVRSLGRLNLLWFIEADSRSKGKGPES